MLSKLEVWLDDLEQADDMTNPFRRLARKARALFQRDVLNRDVDAEMRLHIEMEAHELERTRGLAPDEAYRQATLAFGGVDRFAEAHHDVRGIRWLEDLWQDVRYAARALRRSPAFTITAALVLALGIGASTAIFSAIDAVLVSRLPYPEDDRLVRIFQQNSPTTRFGLSTADYQGLVAQPAQLVRARRGAGARCHDRRCRTRSERQHRGGRSGISHGARYSCEPRPTDECWGHGVGRVRRGCDA